MIGLRDEVHTNDRLKWRRFIVPKTLNKLMTTYSLTKSNKIKVGVDEITVNDGEM